MLGHSAFQLEQIVIGKINVLNVWKEHLELNYGTNDDSLGKYAIKSFVAATKALKEGLIDVLVTAPINKYNIQSEDFKFPGHTDYLDKEDDVELTLDAVFQSKTKTENWL